MTTIRAHIRIKGGHLLSAKNAHRIVARYTQATDRSGNRLDKDGKSPIYERRSDPPYYQIWRLARHPKKGFAFVEVTNGKGLGGFNPNVRQAVMRALFSFMGSNPNLVVEVLPEGCAAPPPMPEHRYRDAPNYKDWHDGAQWCQAKQAKPAPTMKEAA